MEPVDADRFEHDVSAARTFGFLNDVSGLWGAGFARGGSLENTVVLDDEKVLNPDGLRWEDEFVRHKVLDLFGDLALVGMPIQGHVRVERGGHSLHQKLVAAILANPHAWEVVEADKRGARGIRLFQAAAAARF
jgi:UDP-3-O-[3-hydroxymyristoyl] N-acetylglucosamine deacetylase